jgi:hypothetical protein
MSGIHLSESTVERTTEDIGLCIADLGNQSITFGPRVQWTWQRDGKGRTVA